MFIVSKKSAKQYKKQNKFALIFSQRLIIIINTKNIKMIVVTKNADNIITNDWLYLKY